MAGLNIREAGISPIFTPRHLQLDGDFIINLTGGPGGMAVQAERSTEFRVLLIRSWNNFTVQFRSYSPTKPKPATHPLVNPVREVPVDVVAIYTSFPGEYTQLIKQHFIIINP